MHIEAHLRHGPSTRGTLGIAGGELQNPGVLVQQEDATRVGLEEVRRVASYLAQGDSQVQRAGQVLAHIEKRGRLSGPLLRPQPKERVLRAELEPFGAGLQHAHPKLFLGPLAVIAQHQDPYRVTSREEWNRHHSPEALFFPDPVSYTHLRAPETRH